MSRCTLLWLTHNLRLDDNPALIRACESDRLICVYVIEPSWFRANRYSLLSMGANRRRFLEQSLESLEQALEAHGQQLVLMYDTPINALTELVSGQAVDRVVCSEHPGWYEQHTLQNLGSRFPHLEIDRVPTHTLWDRELLPFKLQDLPESFTRFRKKVESLEIPKAQSAPGTLPQAVRIKSKIERFPIDKFGKVPEANTPFSGGEQAAVAHLERYFSSDHPSTYKETRNGLDGWSYSTKFSPWLALGNLSVRRLVERLRQYESEVTQNESTYWIFFELLWREYFQWYAHRFPRTLYAYNGPFKRSPLTSFYPQQFKSWCTGTTPYPIVNACMNQLNETGYMSNRGRQLVASCLVNELQLDWRYGAAYFEQQLVDFDLAANWGNWQYLAGVGADPRGKRQFNLQKQTEIYDPELKFTRTWRGEEQTQPPLTLSYYDT